IFNIRDIATPDHVLRKKIAQLSQFQTARGVYPSTLMGVMAHFRQLWLDAEALQEHQNLYASNTTAYSFPGHDSILEALFPVIDNSIPIYFVADSKEDIERVLKLKYELGFDMVLVSGKEAYTMAGELESRNIPVLASIDMPDKPSWMKKDGDKDTKGDKEAKKISAEEELFRERRQEAYENRATNILSLMQAGVKVGYASNDMAVSEFRENLRTVMEYGLSDTQVMVMLTTETANILGIEADHGKLEAGQMANFSVYSTPLEAEDWKLEFSVSAGELYRINN
ncbi:MAG: amidohydrolase family protein, partial [Balneolales bacterium]